ncbi:ankyrin repeat [Fusarium mundagurra]|uniref:Ankyrin repeat n=1 Tax=Fusarium mundagurra TaxID=1567541 RepID=A0A8H5XZ05_9HYPO|nr:ankyrin repeat [Fusarium mundagurra]
MPPAPSDDKSLNQGKFTALTQGSRRSTSDSQLLVVETPKGTPTGESDKEDGELEDDLFIVETIKQIASVGLWKPRAAKVLLTSRPVPKVELPMRKIPSLVIMLDEKHVDMDISTYVRTTLAKSSIPLTQRHLVTNAVPGRANGLFLYARLALDAFLQPGADVPSVLSQLPANLNLLYPDLIRYHRQNSGVLEPVQLLILQVITHSIRPLRLLELTELISVLSPDGQSRNLKDAKDVVRQACGPLLEVLPDETLSVIHHSFTEYLTGLTRQNEATGYPILQPSPTHSNLAQACLRYLLQSGCLEDLEGTPKLKFDSEQAYPELVRSDIDTHNSFLTKLRIKFPLYEYAAKNWPAHVRSSEAAAYSQGETNSLLQRLFSNNCGELKQQQPINAYTGK